MTIYMIYLGHNKQQLFKDNKHVQNRIHGKLTTKS
jgi:hypothetical protein